jgi:endonuclease/exonuclease/phosphatase family metal-dependent hydrolase
MPDRLGIISCNIHRCIGGDRKTSVECVPDVITACLPDVVALQEVDFGQARPTDGTSDDADD